jgi:hypothetical protein
MPLTLYAALCACLFAAVLYLVGVVRPLTKMLFNAPFNKAQRRLRRRVILFGYGGVALAALAIAGLVRLTLWPISFSEGALIFGNACFIIGAPLEAWHLRRMVALGRAPG